MRLRTIAIIAACVVALPVAGAAILIATFDANSYKPQIIEAARGATGRELRLSGSLHLKPALRPTLVADDVGFANMPGGARPEMARLKQLEVQVALLPLLSRRIEISRLVLVEPDIFLERLADGRANWQFAPPPAPPAQPAASAAPAAVQPGAAPPGRSLGIDRLRIEQGRIALADALTGRTATIAVRALEARLPAAGPLMLETEAIVEGQPVSVKLSAGPLDRLMRPDAADATPWPIELAATAAGATLAIRGSIARPTEGKGYDLAIEAAVPELARLAAFVPDLPLPPLAQVKLSLRAVDRGAALPEIRALALSVGDSALDMLRPDLRLRRLAVSADHVEAPLKFAAEAALSGLAVAAEGEVGPLAALLPGAAPAPWPLRLAVRAGEARFTIDGAFAEPAEAAGLDARIGLSVPDLAALSPLAGQSLPAIRDITLRGRLVEHARRNGYALQDLAATAMGSDLAGEVSLLLARQSRIEATLAGRRIDLDALLAARPAAAAPAPALPAAASAPAPARPADGRVIPDAKLPFDALGLIDLGAGLKVAELVFGATPYRDVGARLALQSGHLAVTEVTATLPSGRLSGGLEVHAGQTPPRVAIALRAPALELATLLPPLGVPFGMRGPMEIDLDVRGRGDTPRAIAATLDGHLGLAMGQGSIDSRLLESAIGELWRLLVPGAPRGGNTAITCAAARFDIAAGQAQARVLLVDMPLAVVSGSGSVNLAQERLGLRLAPTVRLAGGGISVPVNVGGSFAAPSYRADAAGALGGLAAGAAAGAGQGAAVGGPLGAIIGGVVGATRQGAAEAGAGDCPAALAIARARPAAASPAAPATPAAQAPPAQPAQPAPAQPAPQPRRELVPGVPLPRLPFR